jgi:hypothetical protein
MNWEAEKERLLEAYETVLGRPVQRRTEQEIEPSDAQPAALNGGPKE